MSEPASRIELQLRRGRFALSVEATWDERVAVIFGPSGSGKSTLFEALLGFLQAPGARIRLGGRWLEDPGRSLRLRPERRDLGWVPQDAALFPHLTVEQNLRFGAARARRAGPGASLERAVEALEIRPLLTRPAGELSGGERQRVAIARALASGPRALLLDEPLASLDVALRARVLPYLLRVRDALDIPVLYITHDPDEAQLVGERVIVLDAGRVVARGAPREVLWSRSVLPLSEALGMENVLAARVLQTGDGESSVETTAGLRLVVPAALPPGEPVSLGVRAQDLLLAAGPPGRVSARNVLRARVESCELRGGDALVHLRCGDPEAAGEPLVAKVTSGAVDKLGLRPGSPVTVLLKAQAIRRLA